MFTEYEPRSCVGSTATGQPVVPRFDIKQGEMAPSHWPFPKFKNAESAKFILGK